jgi:release factor glutamine methyltransferase
MFLCRMKTVRDALLSFDEALRSLYDKPEIDSVKYLAVGIETNLSTAQLRAFPEKEITGEQSQKIKNILDQLQTGKPIQYILGKTEFYGLPFKVTPSVLIPRPETEELVEWVLSESKESRFKNQETLTILDIGTGSGCIPITIKKHLPNAQVSAIDISADALIIAKENAVLNKVDINFIEADILNPIAIRYTQYAILISNPPYVTEQEKAEMHINVLEHEPHLALFVTDNDPLIFYRAVADFALQHLEDKGLLFFEINENLGKQTVELLLDKGFKNIDLRKDMRGKDRMVRAGK